MASHQARIQCELNRFGLLGKPKDKHGKSIRFKNGAVLKVMIRGNIMRVELFHDGELTPGKSDHKGFMNGDKPYFVTQGTYYNNIEEATTKNIPAPNGQYIFYTQESSIDFTPKNKNFDIYLIRHGEGTHNISKWGPVKGVTNISADLTPTGITQAIGTGSALTGILTQTDVPITLASSDIPRAINTMINIREKSSSPVDKLPIHIVPCSHEIPHKKPPCDGGGGGKGGQLLGMAAGENDGQGYNYYTKEKRNIDYEEYFEFYNGTSRSRQKNPFAGHWGVMEKKEGGGCRKSSMFKQITKLVEKEMNKHRPALISDGSDDVMAEFKDRPTEIGKPGAQDGDDGDNDGDSDNDGGEEDGGEDQNEDSDEDSGGDEDNPP